MKFGAAAAISAFLVIAIALVVDPWGESHNRVYRALHGDLPILSKVIEEHSKKYGSLPDSLEVLVGVDSERALLKRVPRDPWGREYLYLTESNEYTIYSVGRNGMDELMLGDDIVFGMSRKLTCETHGVRCFRARVSSYIKTGSVVVFAVALIVFLASFIIWSVSKLWIVFHANRMQ